MPLLDESLLESIHDRAEAVDRDNDFCAEDIEALVRSGYSRALVPKEFGGEGLSLCEVTRLQRRLAQAAPGAALAINMHLVWTGVAKVLHDRGDDALDLVLREAGEGALFAFGISEAGNERMLFDSKSIATPDGDGGYSITGTKIFTSLSPAWTKLGVHAKVIGEGDEPDELVFGFIERDAEGIEIIDDWDTVGMRASQSRTTKLNNVHLDASNVVRHLPVGPSADLLIFGIFSNFELLLASVYLGIAERAHELAKNAAHHKVALGTGEPYSNDPNIRWRIAEEAIQIDPIVTYLDQISSDVDHLVDHGALWFSKVVGVKYHATHLAKAVVDDAFEVIGGHGYFNGQEIGRLYRDVVAGLFHPSDTESAHATFAQAALGPVTTND